MGQRKGIAKLMLYILVGAIVGGVVGELIGLLFGCLLYTSPSPRDS